jgi:hypothetical protein
MRLGTQSMETTTHAELAERVEAHYDCPNGHITSLPFSIEADVPLSWECHCGALALLRDGDRPELPEQKAQRTHWDMLLERRTIAELEELLEERLELLRAGRA